jgi:hypothetical protein
MNRPKRGLAILSLVVAPVLLACIELFHPAHFTLNPGMTSFLSHPQAHDPYFNAIAYFGPQWWFLMHMVQTPLVVIISFGLLHITDSFGTDPAARYMPFAWLSRVAVVTFMTYCTVLDGIGGIALGRELLVVDNLLQSGSITAGDANAIRSFLDHMWVDPWVGGVSSFVSLLASWAVFVAALGAAAYLYLNRKATWLEAALLIGFGWQLQIAHASYHGPIAFALLALASGLMLARTRPQAATLAVGSAPSA